MDSPVHYNHKLRDLLKWEENWDDEIYFEHLRTGLVPIPLLNIDATIDFVLSLEYQKEHEKETEENLFFFNDVAIFLLKNCFYSTFLSFN